MENSCFDDFSEFSLLIFHVKQLCYFVRFFVVMFDVVSLMIKREIGVLNNHEEQGAGNEVSRAPQEQGSANIGCRTN